MLICCECAREMRCDKNGIGADFGDGHVYAGDRFKCPSCGRAIIKANDGSHQDPDYKKHDEYLFINQKSTSV